MKREVSIYISLPSRVLNYFAESSMQQQSFDISQRGGECVTRKTVQVPGDVWDSVNRLVGAEAELTARLTRTSRSRNHDVTVREVRRVD